MEMDRYDRKILAVLQEHGRLSNQELAEQVGLSPSPCLRRVRALEESEKRMTLEREKLELLRMRATGAVDVPDPEADGEDAEEMA